MSNFEEHGAFHDNNNSNKEKKNSVKTEAQIHIYLRLAFSRSRIWADHRNAICEKANYLNHHENTPI